MNSETVHFESGPADSGKEPFSGPSPKLDRLIAGVRSLEQWYSADFERRITGLTELLRVQITEELRSQFSSQLDSQMESVRKQYEERIYTQSSQWESQRRSLEAETKELRRRSNDLLSEIALTEAAINKSVDQSSLELERLIPDPASMGRLLQVKMEELEVKAYLRGLKFQTEMAQSPGGPSAPGQP